jgi:ABC-2 type transport system permease protein
MPPVLQAITRVVPARYFLTALRGILLKGVGMDVVWPDLAALAVYSGVVLGLASIRLHRQWS